MSINKRNDPNDTATSAAGNPIDADERDVTDLVIGEALIFFTACLDKNYERLMSVVEAPTRHCIRSELDAIADDYRSTNGDRVRLGEYDIEQWVPFMEKTAASWQVNLSGKSLDIERFWPTFARTKAVSDRLSFFGAHTLASFADRPPYRPVKAPQPSSAFPS